MSKLTSAEWANRADAFYEASGKLRQGAATIGGFAADPVSAVNLAADLIDALAATAENARTTSIL